MLVISDLNEDIEYSIPISFIVTLATFSDVNEAFKAKSSFHLFIASLAVHKTSIAFGITKAKFDLEPGSIIKKYLFTRK